MNIEEQIDVCVAALREHNEAVKLFLYGNHLVCIERNATGWEYLAPVDVARMRSLLLQVVEFQGPHRRGTTFAPPDLAQQILVGAKNHFPALIDFVNSPTVAPDGRLIVQPGYDCETGTYYAPAPGFELPEIPEWPTPGQIGAARSLLLDELLVNFPFVDQDSRARAVAAIITPFLRPAISGQVPMAVWSKPVQGTGATLLARLVGIIARGEESPLTTAPQHEDEWRKTIAAILHTGPAVIIIDNLEGRLRSSALSAILTTSSFFDRVLGHNTEVIHLRPRAFWNVTGNNVRLGRDFVRRSIAIRLDAQTAYPARRSGFKHLLPDWAFAHRAELVAAILTLIRAFYASPPDNATEGVAFGGYEEWHRIASGVLRAAGIEGELISNDAAMEVDDEREAWGEFLRAAAEALGARRSGFVAAELLDLLMTSEELRAAAPEDLAVVMGNNESTRTGALGRLLSSRKDQRHGVDAIRLESRGQHAHKRVTQWAIVTDLDECDETPPAG